MDVTNSPDGCRKQIGSRFRFRLQSNFQIKFRPRFRSRLNQGHQHLYSNSRGLTLLELLTSIFIIALVTAIGVPSVQSILNYNRVAVSINSLSRSIAFGRSQAVNNNRHLVMCKSIDQQNCTKKGSWQQGWIVYEDDDFSREREKEEKIIHTQSMLSENLYIKYAGFRSSNFITFRPSGVTLMNGTFTFCIFGQPETQKAVILSKTGRIYISKTGYGGKQLKCPEN